MSGPFIFIGVVSYPGSRFAINQGSDGLGLRLGAALAERGVGATVLVDTENRWEGRSITRKDVQQALTAQTRIEDEWVTYLAGDRPRGARALATSVLRHARREYRRFASPNPSFVVRLLNIELAHRFLMESGHDSGAEWVLIIEDDGYSAAMNDLAVGLNDLLHDLSSSVKYVNLSESFSLQDLGVKSLLDPVRVPWSGTSHREILEGTRPVTNTVCAIAYRTSFLGSLLSEFDSLPMFPVIPIDWKLNKALMNMYHRGDLGSGSCLWVVPGPIDQMSMRSTQ